MKAIERLKQYIDYKGFTNSSFEKKNDLSNGYIATQMKRNADLGEGVLIKILDNCLDLNPLWLLTGNGSMLKSENASRVNEVNRVKKNNTSIENQGIPLIPLDAMAGYGTGGVQVMEYETQRYVVPEFTELKADYIIRLQGNSMTPTYNSGDLVACKRLALNDIFFQWNKVYVLDTEQGALIKRVKKASENHIMLVSDNTDFEPVDLHLSKINAIALVLGVIRLD